MHMNRWWKCIEMESQTTTVTHDWITSVEVDHMQEILLQVYILECLRNEICQVSLVKLFTPRRFCSGVVSAVVTYFQWRKYEISTGFSLSPTREHAKRGERSLTSSHSLAHPLSGASSASLRAYFSCTTSSGMCAPTKKWYDHAPNTAPAMIYCFFV